MAIPYATDLTLWKDIRNERRALMKMFDFADDASRQRRKDQVRELCRILGKPPLITSTLVLRSLGSLPVASDDRWVGLVLDHQAKKPTILKTVSAYAAKHPPRDTPRWEAFTDDLRRNFNALQTCTSLLLDLGRDAPIPWPESILDASRQFLNFADPDGAWPDVPSSWDRWQSFVDFDPVLTSAFNAQARRYFSPDNKSHDDLVNIMRQEVYLTGINMAHERYAQRDRVRDLRAGFIGKPLWQIGKRRVADLPPTVHVPEPAWASFNATGRDQNELRRLLFDLELPPLDKALLELAVVYELPPQDIATHFHVLATVYADTAAVIEETFSLLEGDDTKAVSDLTALVTELRHDADRISQLTADTIDEWWKTLKGHLIHILSQP